jgi:hypothetical protein
MWKDQVALSATFSRSMLRLGTGIFASAGDLARQVNTAGLALAPEGSAEPSV